MSPYFPVLNIDPELLRALLINLGFSILCGGIVGTERGLKGKDAGLKTHVLICLGSMVFTFISILAIGKSPSLDITRIIGQIASGIGFLGAGAIMKSNDDKVHGLTTAAIMWVAAGLGSMIGMGYGLLALVISVVVVTTMYASHWFEDRFIKPSGSTKRSRSTPR